ncbi:MAG: hypothetical protein AMS27_12335 [Bacteroides sp. SM23_62_1]|nr:MAG: hypothetical protein AMS27_12335 [Bacteroides sp. SM23_62_1]
MYTSNVYKNGFPKPCQLILYLLLLAILGFLSCVKINAQDTLKRPVESMLFESTIKSPDIFFQEDKQKLQIVFAYEVILHIIPLEPQPVYGNERNKDEEIGDKYNLKSLEMNSKSEIQSWDFLEEIEDEELKIEEWMIDPKLWQKIIQDQK